MVVDKRVAGIICWLERLKQSYSSGAMEVALMDAECAKADLEILRADVWKKVKPKENNKNKIFSLALSFAKPFFLAVIIVMLMVFPISKEINSPLTVVEKKEELVLAEPIIIVREYEKPKNEIPHTPQKIAKSQKRSTPSQPQKTVASVAKAENLEKVDKNIKAKTVPYDEIFSLVQTGHRALKKDNSVIKVK